MPEKPPAPNRRSDADPASANGDAPTPEQVLDYLLHGVKDEEQKKVITWAFHSEWGGDPNSYNVRDMVIRKVHTLATLRSTARFNRAFAAFLEQLNRAASAFLEQFNAILEAYEARVKDHADAATDGCSQSEAHIQRLEDDIRAWRESEASARAVAVGQIQDRDEQLRLTVNEVLGIASKSYDLSSKASALILVLGVAQVLLTLAVAFIILFKL